MSKFRVNLNQGGQGRLDSGARFGFSVQRTVSLEGPKGINRALNDGEIFEDCNYYKQYCYPNCQLHDAILEILEDDGSIYDTNSKFPIIFNKTIEAHSNCNPKYEVDYHKHCHGKMHSIQITNRSNDNPIFVKFNEMNNAILELFPTETQTFGQNEFSISKLDFINNSSENIKVQILVSVISDSKS